MPGTIFFFIKVKGLRSKVKGQKSKVKGIGAED